jgi:hypothetical protein
MSFAVRNLSVLAYANGFTLWHCRCGVEDSGSVGDANYFRESGDMLAAGDMIIVSHPGGGKLIVVASRGEEVITAPIGGV